MTITGRTLTGGFKEEKKMSKLKKKITIILFAVFALTISFAITGFKAKAKADTEVATCPTSGVFEINDKVGLKLNEDGGMRWILKMDEAHFGYIKGNEAVELGFIIAPKILMDQANGKYYDMQKKIVVTVDKEKIYELTDKDGYHYANGCVINMKAVNRKYDYTAAAYIKNGEKIEKQAAVNENSVKSFYNVSNAAILYSGEDYSEKMLGLTAYDWLGTEEFPIKVDAADQYNSLVEKINAGRNFSDKIIEIGKSVDRSGATLNEGYALPTGTREVCDGDAHAYTNGICVKCNKLQTVGVQYLENADKGIYYVAGYTGLGKDVYVLSEYNGKPVTYVKSEAFANKKITKVVLPASVTELKGGVFLNCYNLKYISMTGVETLNDWNANNNFLNCINLETIIVGKMFEVQAQQFKLHGETAVTNPNIYVDGAKSESSISIEYGGDINNLLSGDVYYKGDASKCIEWNFDVNGNIVHGANAHDFVDGKCENCGVYNTMGVVYNYNEAKDCYYVGDNKTLNVAEITILSKYNDGTHGEKAVTYVAELAFADNTIITKVILPDNVRSLDGGVFQGCVNLEYVAMTGVENLDYNGSASGYGTDRGNNFMNCTALKYVILNVDFTTNCQQFFLNGSNPEKAILDIYVNAANGAPSFAEGTNQNLLTGNIYRKGDASKCFEWNFDVNGNIVHGANAHNFVDGKCSACGKIQTEGVAYALDEANDCYYVSGYTGTSKEVYILGEYEGKPVSYVKFEAFKDNTNITKVVLPASVTDLDGNAFWGCTQLKYLSMVGVKALNYGETQRPYGTRYGNNNFRDCVNLETVIVSNAFSSNVSQFGSGDSSAKAVIRFFVKGVSGNPSLQDDQLLTGTVYFYSENNVSGAWHYVNGVAVLWA